MTSKRNRTNDRPMDESTSDFEDRALLSRIKWGNDAAFRELVARHGRYLYGIAHAMVNNRSDAEDVMQETLAAALKASHRGESSVRTWLVGILVRQAALLRRKRKRFAREGEVRREEASVASPQEAVDARIDVATMLSRLSAEHREVIVLRELQGMSYDEIAFALELPRGTVESRLHRAREQLKGLFGVKR